MKDIWQKNKNVFYGYLITCLVSLVIVILFSGNVCSEGDDALFIDETGNVGIGTTAPNYKLHVNIGKSGFVGFGEGAETGDDQLRFAAPGGYVALQGTRISVADGVPIVLQAGGGNVGIGTKSPDRELDVCGNIHASGWIRGAERGQVLNIQIKNISLKNQTVNSTNWTTIAEVLYTPVSNLSDIIVEFNTRYEIGGFNGPDVFLSRITVNDSEPIVIVEGSQYFINEHGGGTRGSVLFPLMGAYTNSSTSTLTIKAQARRYKSDDNASFYYQNKSTWFKITEIAREKL